MYIVFYVCRSHLIQAALLRDCDQDFIKPDSTRKHGNSNISDTEVHAKLTTSHKLLDTGLDSLYFHHSNLGIT